ncbi:cation transporter [Novipirellula artificiosorum]|uniref:Cadmium, cobalt and zinc/H(+)-K(+) antiporter n=1 Tax=Novipirellula artificiosorum TaxID=2528016 RepID=A0A5C6DSN5_9BACT|nr:cation transporter [Novipirellula artificiosorum]TWU38501.1 Cadmium, cobalt and zinc/H(+)-K(+) antiporter [Novipirellula artificiosorum]
MTDCGCRFEPTDQQQRQTLRFVLLINLLMFILEITVGILAESTGLTADSLDMFADASVYSISLYAVGRAARIRRAAAAVSGALQIVLGAGVLFEVSRRFVLGAEPVGSAMMIMGAIALAANAFCLLLLAKHRHGDVNFRASWIFSANDVIANTGVILSGVLVLLLESQIPDLIIGILIAGIVVRGGIRILREASVSAEPCTPR